MSLFKKLFNKAQPPKSRLPHAGVVTITPSLAKEMLKYNTKNRKGSPLIVARIKRDILEGRWELNGETISIGIEKDGTLVLCDGQTRLTACIESGKPIKSIVTFGTDASTRETIDIGRKRLAHEVLRMKGYAWADMRNISVVRKTFAGPVEAGVYIPPHEIEAFYNEHRKVFDAFFEIAEGERKQTPAYMIAPVVRATIAGRLTIEDMLNFSLAFYTASPPDLGWDYSAALVYRKQAQSLRKNPGGQRSSKKSSVVQHIFALGQTAVLKYIEGERVTKLKPTYSNVFKIPHDEVVQEYLAYERRERRKAESKAKQS